MSEPALTSSVSPWVQRATYALNGYDPRFRRLVHAIKSLLAVALATFAFTWADTQTRLYAGIGAAFLMQCVGAGSRRYQRSCMLITALLMAALSAVGATLYGHQLLQYALLILVAYGTPLVRRRMADHNAFALFCFTITVLATALPGGTDRAWREVLAIAVALAIAYPIYFWVAYQQVFPTPSAPPTERTALRAGLAALLAVIVAYAFGLPRAYWAIMTAVFIVAETWKETFDKSLQRVGMTAAGCVTAWALHFPTAPYPHVQLLLMCLFVFLAVFFRNASYLLMTFFITLYVAFLMAVLGEWTVAILEARLYETAIGCAVSLLASRLVGYERKDASLTRGSGEGSR